MGPTDGLQVQQPVVKEKTQQEIQLEQHLNQLQNWQLDEGQTLEMARTQFADESKQLTRQNREMVKNMRTNVPQAVAQRAAGGTPVQQVPPTQDSYKERKRQKKETAKAKRVNPTFDYNTYRTKTRIADLSTAQHNSSDEFYAEFEAKNMDPRVMNMFCVGHRRNIFGKPCTRQDAAYREHDRTMMRAFLDDDTTQRDPYLDSFTTEILSAQLTPACMTDEYMRNNIEEVRAITSRACCFDNLLNDPRNKAFFDAMDPVRKSLLMNKITAFASYSTLFNVRMNALGVDVNHAEYASNPAIAVNQGMHPTIKTICASAIAVYASTEKILVKTGADAQMLTRGHQLHINAQAMRNDPQYRHLGITADATRYAYDDLLKYRNMITDHPEAYAANAQLADKLYQQMHHGLDAMSDLISKSAACQSYIDDHPMMGYLPPDVLLMHREMTARMEAMDREITLVREHINACSDTLTHLLRGKTLTAPAFAVTELLGFNAQELVNSKIRSVTPPPPTVGAVTLTADEIAAQEQILREAIVQGDEVYAQNHNSADAKVAFGIRDSRTEAAKAFKSLCGTTCNQLAPDILEYMKQLEKVGVPFATINANSVKTSLSAPTTLAAKTNFSAAAFSTGGGLDEVSDGLLKMFSDYMESQPVQDLFQRMNGIIGDANMFEGNREEVADFLLQQMLTLYGANFTMVGTAPPGTFSSPDDARMVAREACRTILALPAMLRMPQDERDATLSPANKELLSKYTEMVQKIAARFSGTSSPVPPAAPEV